MAISGTYSAGDAVSYKDCFVEVDIQDDGTWADIDSWATEIQVSGEEVPTTETYPFEGSAIVFAGSKSPVRVDCTIVFTQGSTDPYKNIRDRFEAVDGAPFEIRFAPAGSAANNLMFTTSGGKLVAAPPPTGTGAADSATVVTFSVQADSLAVSTM